MFGACQGNLSVQDCASHKASVAELVDAVDLKSIVPRTCGFESRRRYLIKSRVSGRAVSAAFLFLG